ncbi:MAG: hypothetical protein PHP50_00455 [Lachnospiraceae bacterium]|nr:hypothetical protein [Lachnospiraceae bacterium]
MGDKNPKHPLKKKKMVQKMVNISEHEISTENSSPKAKKHNTY